MTPHALDRAGVADEARDRATSECGVRVVERVTATPFYGVQQLLLPVLAALVTAAVLTPVVRAFARRMGLIAAPSKDRWHARPTALCGGIAVYAGFMVGAGLQLALAPAGTGLSRDWVGIVSAATLMFAVGLVDDKLKLRPATKMIFQALAAAVIISCGVVYPITPWFAANALVTFFWFLALTNALNLLDNMDGVAAGVAGIAALSLAGAFALDGAWTLSGICLVLAGAAAGFLPFNFHRASIFMGDSGSLFLGSLLASLGAAYPRAASASIVTVLFVPAAVVILPILDTTLVTIGRTLAGRPISVGGRDHTSHRLVALGLGEREVALLLYGVSAAGGAVALLIRGVSPSVALPLGGLFLAGLLIFTAYLGRMHAYEPSEARRGRVTLLVADLLHKRRAFEMVLDLILFAAAYQVAFLLRWDGSPPPAQEVVFQRTLALAVIVKSLSFGLMGAYRGTWQHMTMPDLHRLMRATVLGAVATVVVVNLAIPGSVVPRSVFALDTLLVALLVAGARVSFQSLQLIRHSLGRTGRRTLIYGAGSAAHSLVREIIANPHLDLRPVGFVDDDPAKRGRLVHGYQVLGTGKDLDRLASELRVGALVLCSRHLSDRRIAEVERTCAALGVEVLQFNLEIQAVWTSERVRSAQLRAGNA